MRWRGISLTGTMLGLLHAQAAWGAATGPLEVRLTNCEPQWDCPQAGVCDTSPIVAQEPGYLGPGYHNVPGARRFRAQLAYNTAGANDSVTDALDLVESIYLCRVEETSPGSYTVDCPSTSPWVIWDKSAGIDAMPDDAFVGRGAQTPPVWEGAVQLDLDWQDLTESTVALVLRVQLDGAPQPANTMAAIVQDATTRGACSNWTRRDPHQAGERFVVYGPAEVTLTDPANPAGPRANLCNLPFTWGHDPAVSVCVTEAQAEFTRVWMETAQNAHQFRLQIALPPTDWEYSWRNGSDGLGGHNPHYVLLGPHVGGFGQSTGGGVQINPHNFWEITPRAASGDWNPPSVALPGAGPHAIQLTMHEYLHSFQATWGREEPATQPLAQGVGYVSESQATSTEMNLCLEDFPGAATADERRCMNSGKLGVFAGGRYGGQYRQAEPRYDLITTPYESGIFWGYLFEQFAYPLGRASHPSGTASTIARPGPNSPSTALAARDSDEGMDLLGLIFQQYAATGAGINPFDALDPALESHLGRSFRDVLLDFHTALYLKDYSDTDPRWRLEWTDDDGFSSSDPIADARPFVVPPDLYGATCGVPAPGSTDARCDGLVRTRRALDSWRPGIAAGPATRDLLDVGETLSSPGTVAVGAYGTTAVSVSPAAGWAGSDLRVLISRQRARPLRLRLFRIQADATSGALTPEPLCDPDCTFTGDDTHGRDVFTELVPIDGDTVEVLGVVSTGEQGGAFEWSFGASTADLTIISPATAKPALVGHPNVGRQPFVLAMSIRDEDGNPLDVSEADKSDLVLEAPGCADTTSCVLPEDAYTLVPVSGGAVLAVVTLPESFYPTGVGAMDILATYRGTASDEQPYALLFDEAGHPSATALVLDHSGSMAWQGGAKLAALKAVAKGIVSSLVPAGTGAPPNQLAIVTFRDDATTDLPFGEITADTQDATYQLINDLEAHGATAIGDALYEAQYELARAFDGDASAPARKSLVLLSDGENTIDAEPWLYYDRGVTPAPTEDGNSDWSSIDLLCYADRLANGAATPVPEISAVGFGQDADLAVLDEITRLSGNTPLYVPDSASVEALTAYGVTAELAEGYGDAVSRSLGFDRIGVHRIFGSDGSPDEPPVPEPPAGTGGAAPILRAVIGEGGVTYDVDPDYDPGADGGEGGGTLDVDPDYDPTGAVAHFVVEPGAQELRVVVTTGEAGATEGTLYSPSNVVVPHTGLSDDGRGRAFRVVEPEPGEWHFNSSANRREEPHVVVDATISGSYRLFVVTDADELSERGDVIAGARVSLRTVPVDGGPVTECSLMRATVRRPNDLTTLELDLHDDGLHGDGLAGDGVFGATFSRTGAPGAYGVTVRSTCTSPVTSAAVHRERVTGFVVSLQPEDDPDGDGMPTWWEEDCLDPQDPGDVDSDPDGDGLTNLVELGLGTSPCLSDTDGGGESDASEADPTRNPLDPGDDRVSTPIPELTPGDAQVYVVPAMGTDGGTLVAEWAPAATGPWSPVPGPWEDGFVLHDGLTNGQRYCYRIRFESPTGAITAWSEPRCAVPNVDPTPPHLEVMVGIHACGAAYVQPELRFYDMPYVSDFSTPKVDLGIAPSGVTEMRIWAGNGPPPATTTWRPATPNPLIRLTAGVSVYSVQVRDRAGNLSSPVSLLVTCPNPPCANQPAAIGCCASVENCTGMDDYALFAQGTLRVADATRIVKPGTTEYAPIANSGTGEVNLGVETTSGSLWAQGPVVLRDRARVQGDAFAGGTIQLSNGAVVTGERSPGRNDMRFPALSGLTVPFPAVPGPDVWLEPDRSRTVAPGNYARLNVASRSKVSLRSGTYFFTSVNLEPSSQARFTTTNGPVYLYVKDSFTYKGAFVDLSGKHDRVVVVYMGTGGTSIETPFSGTLVAPRARVDLKTVTGAHRGSFYAKDLEVHSRTRVEHYPFIAPWLGGLVAGESWRASEEPNPTVGGCACAAAGGATGSALAPWLALTGLGVAGMRLGSRRRRRESRP